MIAIGIVAHPARQAMAERLAEQVNADIICLDNRGIGAEANHRRTWQSLLDYHADHTVVLEDDAMPVQDFRHQCEQALKASPTHITSLYLGRLRPPQYQNRIARAITNAQHRDAHYIADTRLLHAVGFALTTEHIEPMLAFTATRDYLPWDEAVTAYAKHSGQRVAYTHPSLIDHQDGPTLIAHRDHQPRRAGRIAWRVGTRHHWERERTVTM